MIKRVRTVNLGLEGRGRLLLSGCGLFSLTLERSERSQGHFLVLDVADSLPLPYSAGAEAELRQPPAFCCSLGSWPFGSEEPRREWRTDYGAWRPMEGPRASSWVIVTP